MIILIWSDEADNDLASIYEYIARDSVYYAKTTLRKIINRGKQISAFPYSGTQVPEYQDPTIRQVFEGNYRIIYHIGEGEVTILAIVHAARDMLQDG